MTLYLYRISATASGYDVYDSAVVVAKSEKAAKRIHPNGRETLPLKDDWATWPNNPLQVSVERVGTANSKQKEGEVIVASFNAG